MILGNLYLIFFVVFYLYFVEDTPGILLLIMKVINFEYFVFFKNLYAYIRHDVNYDCLVG